MTDSTAKKTLETIEKKVWQLFKPFFQINQLYQRQTFGKITAIKASAFVNSSQSIQKRNH